jgi:hypothetical protein
MRTPRTGAARSLLSAVPWALSGAVACAALVVGFAACFDLFHSTTDVLSACELDARAAGCAPEAGAPPAMTDAGTNFCGWSQADARQHAAYACAWLGACETPAGRNAFGACMFEALLAYDCEANPYHRSRGKGHALWDCLWQVKTCAGVDNCVLPAGPQGCGAGAPPTACGSTGDAGASNADVRLLCADAGRAYGENCALWGQTCAESDAGATCAGSADAGSQCSFRECAGASLTEIRWCDDGGDQGIDCASNGAGHCGGFLAGAPPWAACLVEGGAGPCEPNPSATCANGVATSCPTGVLETIDCAALLQADAGADAACHTGALSPLFDWTSPCRLTETQCTETCSDAGIDAGVVGCDRGATFSTGCAAQNLGPCREVDTSTGSSPACMGH